MFTGMSCKDLVVKEFCFMARGICRRFFVKFLAATFLEIEGRKSAKFFAKFSPLFSPISAKHFARISLSGFFGITKLGPQLTHQISVKRNTSFFLCNAPDDSNDIRCGLTCSHKNFAVYEIAQGSVHPSTSLAQETRLRTLAS